MKKFLIASTRPNHNTQYYMASIVDNIGEVVQTIIDDINKESSDDLTNHPGTITDIQISVLNVIESKPENDTAHSDLAIDIDDDDFVDTPLNSKIEPYYADDYLDNDSSKDQTIDIKLTHPVNPTQNVPDDDHDEDALRELNNQNINRYGEIDEDDVE